MKNKEAFIECLKTLLFSWGADSPPEAVWAANELLEWAEEEYGVTITNRFLELDEILDLEKTDPKTNYTNLVFDELMQKL